MADHNKPTVTSNYLDFVSEMHGRMDDLAVGFDPERTSATNVPNYSIRWSSAAKKWQYLDGSSWKDLTNEYAINISGTAQKLKTPRTISITGGGTAQPVQFDGSANVQLTLESLDLANLTGLGSAAGADVVQSTGNSKDDVMSQKAVTDALDSIEADIGNLGSAATRDVGTSSGNVLENGAFGLGNVRKINDNSVATRFAYYAPGTQPPGYPSGWYGYGALWSIYHGYSGNVSEFIVTHTNNSTFAFRHSRDGAWREIYHTGNKPSWGDISGKPSSFNPSSHNHSASNITSGTLPGARMPMTAGGVGTYAFVVHREPSGPSTVNWGGTIAGSNLAPYAPGASSSTSTFSPALSGTWRIMGEPLRRTNQSRVSNLAVRIS